MLGLLVILCIVLIWMTIRAQHGKSHERGKLPGDKEKIIKMLSKVNDQSALSAYKKAYKIEDHEIIKKE